MLPLCPRLPRSFAAMTVASMLTVLSAGACARSDASPVRNGSESSLGRETKTAAGQGTLRDSVSNDADRGRIRGADSARVWLIEISDFECPFCKRFHDEAYATIDREYVQSGKVRLAYINYPLTSIHRNALAAAEAAMCASAQGKFWQLHDGLYDTQTAWASLKDPMPVFDSIAVASKTDSASWHRCMSSHATMPLINADRDRASRAGVQSTPTFFIGDRGLIGVNSVGTFRLLLDSAIAMAHGARVVR